MQVKLSANSRNNPSTKETEPSERTHHGRGNNRAKKTLRVIVIESSDEESEANALTAAFARLTASPSPPGRHTDSAPALVPTATLSVPLPASAAANAPAAAAASAAATSATAASATAAPATAAPATTTPVAATTYFDEPPPPPYTPASGQPLYRGALDFYNSPPSPRATPSRRQKCYVVSVGRCTGVFNQWNLVSSLVSGVPGGSQQSYKHYDDALSDYLNLKARGLVKVKRHPGDELLFGPIEYAMQ